MSTGEGPSHPQRYVDEHLVFDSQAKVVRVDCREILLTRKEQQLLALLVENKGFIVPRELLLEKIWGYCQHTRTRTLDVHVRRLRKKLFPYGKHYIETVFGVGYRFLGYQDSKKLRLAPPQRLAV
ncbi:MAG: winged helix-turn-helix domain-containing protein [Bryobacteraceae bacterium]|nr:winged helix-turn-helix domain-containing protein [Bryobacteraceae bacterium]MDW8379710.1 winged helix-turn-helix domain-containing protein [Bryobacterales bacterium]